MTTPAKKHITVTKDDLELNFPDPEEALYASHLRNKISWENWVQEMTPAWKRYMSEFDSREQRKRDPNEERFVL